MTQAKKRRMRRRRRLARSFKRTVMTIILTPARMPRISPTMASQAMKTSEIAGGIMVASLMALMFNPTLFKTTLVILSSLVFVTFLIIVKLEDYQTKLDEMSLYLRF